MGELSCNWMVTNGFTVKIENRGVARIFQGGGGGDVGSHPLTPRVVTGHPGCFW